ncbi:MAG TPA: MarR family transcriptional regulator [Roseiflexaceae bacterium]|nr:MarR family transcriptional regulator [Roseiflexaceae bacterium]
MAERLAQDDRVMAIDRIFRELTWHGQKHAIRTLTRPEIGLTMPQMITLLAIHDSGSCRMGTLADVTQQSGGTLTGIVDRLIDDGLVERVRSVNDRRVIEVTLTEEGQARVRQVLDARYVDMERILAHFDDAQLGQFEQLLELFIDGVRGELPPEEEPPRELGA